MDLNRGWVLRVRARVRVKFRARGRVRNWVMWLEFNAESKS